MTLEGAAASPRTTFRPNPPGAGRRSIEFALQLARDEGVIFEDEDFLFVCAAQPLGPGRYATYFALDIPQGHGRTMMIDLEKMLTADGRFRVVVCPTTLDSDDAIVATIAHEVHEISALRKEFEGSGGRLSAQTVYSLVNTETGRLHCAAWAHADTLVTRRQLPRP